MRVELGPASLFFQFKRAHHRLYVTAGQRAAEATGVPAAQVSAVVHLVERDGLSVRELGDLLGLQSAAATGLVARLERDGLVERTSNDDDGRAHRVFVTRKGRTIAKRVAPVLSAVTEQMTAGFNATDIETVRRFLTHITTAFGGVETPVAGSER